MLSAAILLGPQRHVPLVREAVASLLPEDDAGLLAAVTAGWEEREAEDQELRDHVRRPLVNLAVWARVERIFQEDPELFAAMRQRHDTLRGLQELYRLRLHGQMEALQELFRRSADDPLLLAERHDALVMLQGLDDQHIARVQAVHHEFEARWRPAERPSVLRQRAELRSILGEASCLLIAGGHVAVLLHRLRLFDVLGLHGDRPVVAWSAGAMALCERIVLFHDTPPQGSAHAEVMEAGLGLVPGLVALPHAQKRLRTDEPRHVELFARRFQPAQCVLLDPGSRVDWRRGRWRGASGTLRLGTSGLLEELPEESAA